MVPSFNDWHPIEMKTVYEILKAKQNKGEGEFDEFLRKQMIGAPPGK